MKPQRNSKTHNTPTPPASLNPIRRRGTRAVNESGRYRGGWAILESLETLEIASVAKTPPIQIALCKIKRRMQSKRDPPGGLETRKLCFMNYVSSRQFRKIEILATPAGLPPTKPSSHRAIMLDWGQEPENDRPRECGTLHGTRSTTTLAASGMGKGARIIETERSVPSFGKKRKKGSPILECDLLYTVRSIRVK